MIKLDGLLAMHPRIHPKQGLTGLDSLLGVLSQQFLLIVPLLIEPDPAIAMIAAVGGKLRDLGVIVGVDIADVGGQAVAHDEDLGVSGQAQQGDASVKGQYVLVVLVQHEVAEGQGAGLEGRLGVARRAVDGRRWVRPAGVRPGRPLEVLEGDAERETHRVGGAVVEDVLRGGFVLGKRWIVAAEGGRVEGVLGVGPAFIGGERGVIENSFGEVGDVLLGGIDFVEDCKAVLGWIVGGDIGAAGEAAEDHRSGGHNAQG